MAFFECTIGGGDGSTLTVTCYSGFAGLTISITNGVDTFSEVCPSTSPYEVVFEGLANGTWTLSTVYNGITYTETVEVNLTSQFFPIPDGATVTPTDDIQTWLLCASIFDKNYTSIAQVLADASTLQALIASHNAVDYMARSTTWASSVTANSNAMTYISANNYCADTLLADDTWLNAICNSTYFATVLNVKVPTMTSATSPSGSVTASGYFTSGATYYPYYAFDGNNNSQWIDSNDAQTLFTSWIQYAFPSAIRVYKAVITQTGLASNDVVMGSNNNSNFTNLSSVVSFNHAGSTLVTKSVVCNLSSTKFRYIRLSCTRRSSGEYVRINTLQFYGRA